MPTFNLEHQYDEGDCYPRRIDEIYGSIRSRDLIGCPSWAPNLSVHADAAEYLDMSSWPTASYGAISGSSSNSSTLRNTLSVSGHSRSTSSPVPGFTPEDISYLACEIFENVQRGVNTDDADLDVFEFMLRDQFVIRTRKNPSSRMRRLVEDSAFWFPTTVILVTNAFLLCRYPNQYRSSWDNVENRTPSTVGILSWLCWFLTFTLSAVSLARSIWTGMDGDCVRRQSPVRDDVSMRMIWSAAYVWTDCLLVLISGFMLINREVQMV